MSIQPTRSEAGVVGSRGDEGTDNESFTVSMFAEIVDEQDNIGAPPVQLYDHIDPEALGQLLSHAETKAESDWELTFTVEDVDVTVTSDGEFTVR